MPRMRQKNKREVFPFENSTIRIIGMLWETVYVTFTENSAVSVHEKYVTFRLEVIYIYTSKLDCPINQWPMKIFRV